MSINKKEAVKSAPDSLSMVEYQVQGLSCPNCTREMEEEIQKLQHGEYAKLSYNSGRLILHPDVDLKQVSSILKGDGAKLVTTSQGNSAEDGNQSASAHEAHAGHSHSEQVHTHDHSPEGNQRQKWLLIAAAVLYAVALAAGELLPDGALILLYLTAIGISGYTTFWRGLRNLRRLKFNMDTLMTVALTGAVIIGEWREATLVAILFGLNELLEGYGMNRARKSMEALLAAAPKEAAVLKDGETHIIPISALEPGNIVRVRAGEKIPSDGIVHSGTSAVNEAAITGEAIPVNKKKGDAVFGGSVNSEGLLDIEISRAYEDSSLAKIMHLVKEAQDTKTPTELFIDKFAKYYTPAIMIIALLVVLVPPLFAGEPWLKWLYQGLAILIVGCPCSLVLSSPIALVSGMTRSARSGILIKGGVHLEQLGKLEAIAFDKTGTLTLGTPAVMEEALYEEAEYVYKVALALEQSSLHPLGKAVVRYAADQLKHTSDFMELSELTAIPGVGVEGRRHELIYRAGNESIITLIPDLAQDQLQRVTQDMNRLKEKGYTIILLADSTRVLGMLGLADQIRPETQQVIRQLHDSGIQHTVMLTGDHEQSAHHIAKQAGITDYYASLLPEQKVTKIKELSLRWKVGMVGDGINDAPALATAQLGIAMGKGTDSAIETADIVLMQDHLGRLPSAIRTARQVNRIIKWNITLSLALKAVALLLTIPGWLTLWIAILSDMGATVIVTLLGMSILLGRDQD